MNSQILGDLEKEIMKVIWQVNSKITVRDVVIAVSKRRKVAYTTVMTIMGRLVEKGLLKRKTSGRSYVYQATYSKDKFLSRVSHQIIQNLVASFGDVAIANFTKEIEKIPLAKRRRLIKALERANE